MKFSLLINLKGILTYISRIDKSWEFLSKKKWLFFSSIKFSFYEELFFHA